MWPENGKKLGEKEHKGKIKGTKTGQSGNKLKQYGTRTDEKFHVKQSYV